MSSIQTLPPEILAKTFEYLDIPSQNRTKEVCAIWKSHPYFREVREKTTHSTLNARYHQEIITLFKDLNISLLKLPIKALSRLGPFEPVIGLSHMPGPMARFSFTRDGTKGYGIALCIQGYPNQLTIRNPTISYGSIPMYTYIPVSKITGVIRILSLNGRITIETNNLEISTVYERHGQNTPRADRTLAGIRNLLQNQDPLFRVKNPTLLDRYPYIVLIIACALFCLACYSTKSNHPQSDSV